MFYEAICEQIHQSYLHTVRNTSSHTVNDYMITFNLMTVQYCKVLTVLCYVPAAIIFFVVYLTTAAVSEVLPYTIIASACD